MSDLYHYHKKLKCVERETLKTQGDINSPRARSFVIQLDMCKLEKGIEVICKSEQEIKEWLKQEYIWPCQTQEGFGLKNFAKIGFRVSHKLDSDQ